MDLPMQMRLALNHAPLPPEYWIKGIYHHAQLRFCLKEGYDGDQRAQRLNMSGAYLMLTKI